jgi:transglutaminase-like putative cysteine protease
MNPAEPFLRVTSVVDGDHPEIRELAHELSRGRESQQDVARACFEWVRDEVRHTVDYRLDTVTCAASEVLKERTGFCYAKSHLLAALLRVNGIPTGFAYQRLALDDQGSAFCLHGLNAVWLPQVGWYRLDPRGNRNDLQAHFDPPREVLPFACVVPGERLFPRAWAEPLPIVVEALRRYRTRMELEANLPDAADLDRLPTAAGCVVDPRSDRLTQG